MRFNTLDEWLSWQEAVCLHARELAQIFAATQQKGYTCIPTAMYWKGKHVKVEIALAKGKHQQDKRASKTIIDVVGVSFGQLVGPAKKAGTATHGSYPGGAKALVETVCVHVPSAC